MYRLKGRVAGEERIDPRSKTINERMVNAGLAILASRGPGLLLRPSNVTCVVNKNHITV